MGDFGWLFTELFRLIFDCFGLRIVVMKSEKGLIQKWDGRNEF